MSLSHEYIILEPHQDDIGLFACYICLRFKPLIVSVTDGTQHEQKFGISIETRRNESRKVADILGCDIRFLGIPDTEDIPRLDLPKIIESIRRPNNSTCEKMVRYRGTVLSPAKQGGNKHHDQLSKYGQIHYATYTKENLRPYLEDGIAIQPTSEEVALKKKALACYKSQHEINKEHFEAVSNGRPEYIFRGRKGQKGWLQIRRRLQI